MERRPELGPMAEVWVTRPRPCCASPASSTECAVACRVSSLERILMEPGDETETHHTTERPTSTFPEPGSNRPMDELMRAIGFGDFLGLTCLSPSLVYALPRKPANGTTALYKGVLPPGGEVSRHPIAVVRQTWFCKAGFHKDLSRLKESDQRNAFLAPSTIPLLF
ncbi:hypothetical protein PGT21_014989 [Puccinia graminis f. sp. tritici]|uniref:Uncharacterized protein n=1 Tax=Puccinia graminis f. sp. tritici TaxID=56615 RepID=A0A5B0N3U8_PUCGR|nr:hypothetical protein PGT21_014989 [Puccinia graminis f. sp. tritici]